MYLNRDCHIIQPNHLIKCKIFEKFSLFTSYLYEISCYIMQGKGTSTNIKNLLTPTLFKNT